MRDAEGVRVEAAGSRARRANALPAGTAAGAAGGGVVLAPCFDDVSGARSRPPESLLEIIGHPTK